MIHDVALYARIIANWLDRPIREMCVQELSAIKEVVGTTIGEVRKQNQDRVAVTRFVPSRNSDHAFLLHVLCDGIGGMKNGAECADLAVTAVIDSCVRDTVTGVHDRLRTGIKAANDAIHRVYKGDGGTTIAAVLVSRNGLALATVGDSRIYAYEPRSRRLQQVSQDDTLQAELTRLRGSDADRSVTEPHLNQLTQFVGIGSELEIRLYPEIKLPPFSSLLLTSDGVHSLPMSILAAILRSAPSPAYAMTRILQVARWCGGQDNGSVIFISPEALVEWNAGNAGIDGIDGLQAGVALEIWDGAGSLTIPISALPRNEKTKERQQPKENKTPSERRRKSGVTTARGESRRSPRELGPSLRPAEQRKFEIEISSNDESNQKTPSNSPNTPSANTDASDNSQNREGNSGAADDSVSKRET